MDLPGYIAINDRKLKSEVKKILRMEAKTLAFPLSKEDIVSVSIVEAKFDQEENMAGLAAPQIGISKKIIVFEAPDDKKLKKWRPDLTQTMPKTIWINATYTGIDNDKRADYEGCFSVNDLAGDVSRYYKIKYTAYTPEGKFVEGEAEGYLARVIQHEVDHTMGKLFIDYLDPSECMDITQYRKLRKESLPKADF